MSDMSSDQPLGPGWWMASDGRYYPPSLHHDPAHQAAYATAEPAQATQTVAPVQATQTVAPVQAVAPMQATQPVMPTQPAAPAAVTPPVVDDLAMTPLSADPFAFPQPQTAAPSQIPTTPQPAAPSPTPQAHSFAIPGEQTTYPTATPSGPPDQAWAQPGQQPPQALPTQPVTAPMPAGAPAPVAPTMPAQPAPVMAAPQVPTPVPQTPPATPQPAAPSHPPVAAMPTQPPAPQAALAGGLPTPSVAPLGDAAESSASKIAGLKSPLVFAGAGLFGLLCAVALGSMLFGRGGGEPVASPDSLPMVESGTGDEAGDAIAGGDTAGADLDSTDLGGTDQDAMPAQDAVGAPGGAGDGTVDAATAQAYVQWAGGEGAAVSEGVSELLTLVTAMDGELAAGPSAELDASCTAAEQRSAGLLADPAAFPYSSDPDEIHRQHVQDFAEATKRAASLCLVGDLPGAVENAAAAIASSWEMNDREFALLEQQ